MKGGAEFDFTYGRGGSDSDDSDGAGVGDALLDFGADPYELSASEMLSDNVVMSRKLDFRFGSYFAKGWHLFRYNFTTMVAASFVWLFVLGGVELALYGAFGHVNGDNVWFFRTLFDEEEAVLRSRSHQAAVAAAAAASPHGPGNIHKYVTRHHWRYVSVLCLFLSRALVFYPLLGSAYVACFGAMRRSSQLVHLSDLFACFRTDQLPRFFRLGTVCFGANFLLVYLLPEYVPEGVAELSLLVYVAYYVFTFFAVPMFAEHEHATVLTCFRYSAYVVNGRWWRVFFFAAAIFVLQVLGFALMGVGALVAVPLSLCANAWCYHHLLRCNDVPWAWGPL